MHSRRYLSLSPAAQLYKSRSRQDHIQDSHRRIGLETSVRTQECTKRSGAHRPSRHLVSVPDTRGSKPRTEQNEGCLRISRLRPFPCTRGPTRLTTEQRSQTFRPKKWSDNRWP